MLFLQRNTSEQSGTSAHYANKTTFLPASFLSKADFYFVSNQKRISTKEENPRTGKRGEKEKYFFCVKLNILKLFFTHIPSITKTETRTKKKLS